MMVLTRCDTTFHERIAGKYRLGRRVRGRWPSLFFRGRGTGDSYGKIWSTILIRLEFHQPRRKSSAATGRNMGGARLALFPVTNHPFAATPEQQEIRLSSRVFDHLYPRIPERLVPERSGFGEKAEQQLFTRVNFSRYAPLRGHTGSAVSGRGPSPLRPSLLDMTIRRAAYAGKWRVLPMLAPGEAVPRKTGILPGNQSSMAGGEGHRQDALRLPPLVEKPTTHLPPLIRQLRKRGSALTTQAAPLVQRAFARQAGPGAIAGKPAQSGSPLQGAMEGRRMVSVLGTFRKQGERAPAGDGLVFTRQGEVEREVAGLKEAIAQTRKLVAERVPSPAVPTETEVMKQIDMERIADRVYRDIERRIRREREARGM